MSLTTSATLEESINCTGLRFPMSKTKTFYLPSRITARILRIIKAKMRFVANIEEALRAATKKKTVPRPDGASCVSEAYLNVQLEARPTAGRARKRRRSSTQARAFPTTPPVSLARFPERDEAPPKKGPRIEARPHETLKDSASFLRLLAPRRPHLKAQSGRLYRSAWTTRGPGTDRKRPRAAGLRL